MSSTDIQVVILKILAYLYECMKNGVTPTMGGFGAEVLGINQHYWKSVLEELSAQGLIKGVEAFKDMNGNVIEFNVDHIAITYQGVEFLQEDKGIMKALLHLKAAGETASAITSLFGLLVH